MCCYIPTGTVLSWTDQALLARHTTTIPAASVRKTLLPANNNNVESSLATGVCTSSSANHHLEADAHVSLLLKAKGRQHDDQGTVGVDQGRYGAVSDVVALSWGQGEGTGDGQERTWRGVGQ